MMPYSFVPSRWMVLVVIGSCVVLFVMLRPTPTLRLSSWTPPGSTAGVSGTTSVSQDAPLTAMLGQTGISVPLRLGGDLTFNVEAALDASNGALRDVTIAPGATWSFNATVGNPANVAVRSIGGVPGGGWCDLAARYVQAVRPLLPPESVRFVNHVTTSGIALANVANADAVSIWNIDGLAGSEGSRQDLEITNSLKHPLHFRVIEQPDGSALVVQVNVVADM